MKENKTSSAIWDTETLGEYSVIKKSPKRSTICMITLWPSCPHFEKHPLLERHCILGRREYYNLESVLTNHLISLYFIFFNLYNEWNNIPPALPRWDYLEEKCRRMKWHKNSKKTIVNFNVIMQAMLTDVWDFVKNQNWFSFIFYHMK